MSTIPHHIAIIMDGNRRWARQHKMAIIQGHEYVSNTMIERLSEHCIKRGVKYLTLWAFSTENWKRDKAEVEGLMKLFRDGLKRNGEKLHKKGVRIRTIGEITQFPADIQEGMAYWIKETANNQNLTVAFALNYGGRDEILRAIQRVAKDVDAKELANRQLSEEQFAQYLDTAELPDPELIIRPGGEQRLSGFLPWQSTYSEFYFPPVLMPDFDEAELDKAIEEFSCRKRNFGK